MHLQKKPSIQAYLEQGKQQNCCYGVKFWLCFWVLAAQTSDNDQHWWSPRRWSGFTLKTLQPSQIWLWLKAVWRKSAGLEQMCPNPILEQGLGGGGGAPINLGFLSSRAENSFHQGKWELVVCLQGRKTCLKRGPQGFKPSVLENGGDAVWESDPRRNYILSNWRV